mgnify:CR=1 FL=1
MTRYRPAYPPEFRRQMIDLVRAGRTPEELSREFEPSAASIAGWARRADGEDVTDTLELALEASGCDRPTVEHRPRLLSDNGSSYIAGDLAVWLKEQRMEHVRGVPNHPQSSA